MNEIEKLNERIAQLTDLVKSGEETISATKEMLKLAEQERDRLADQRRKSDPTFKRVEGSSYYSVGITTFPDANGQSINVVARFDDGHAVDIHNYTNNNYFKTMQRAEEVVDKINLLLKLERLHDTFCPDFNLGLGDGLNVNKYYVFYSFIHKMWMWSHVKHTHDAVQVYFPTQEIAQKVCDILNTELEEHYES